MNHNDKVREVLTSTGAQLKADAEKLHHSVHGRKLAAMGMAVDDALSALTAHEQEVAELVEALKRFANPHMTLHGALVVSDEDVKAARAALRPFTGGEK